MRDEKLTLLHGGNTKNQHRDAIRAIRESMPDLIEHMQLMAQLHKAKFDALKAQGFTDDQALELCKSVL